ncbi:von Willebrand factor A domain-containing protein 7-like [Arapaima gigas]
MSLLFSLLSGENQSSTEPEGPLGTIQTVGNLYRVRLTRQVGQWTVSIKSRQPFSLRVTGRSPVDFIFMFVERTSGNNTGLDLKEGRPQAGKNATLYLTVSDSTTLTVTEVSLVPVSGSGEVSGTTEALGRGNYLVSLDRVPDVRFSVRLVGQLDTSTRLSSKLFQRQSNTLLRSSNLTVAVRELGSRSQVKGHAVSNSSNCSSRVRRCEKVSSQSQEYLL